MKDISQMKQIISTKDLSTFFIATVNLEEVEIRYVDIHFSVLGVRWRDGVLDGG